MLFSAEALLCSTSRAGLGQGFPDVCAAPDRRARHRRAASASVDSGRGLRVGLSSKVSGDTGHRPHPEWGDPGFGSLTTSVPIMTSAFEQSEYSRTMLLSIKIGWKACFKCRFQGSRPEDSALPLRLSACRPLSLARPA